MGDAFQSGGRTSPEQFRRDPASMRLETQPIIDKGANKGLVITIQVWMVIGHRGRGLPFAGGARSVPGRGPANMRLETQPILTRAQTRDW